LYTSYSYIIVNFPPTTDSSQMTMGHPHSVYRYAL